MIIYSDENPPKRGTGLGIYKALKVEGWKVEDLHYNPPAWGNLKELGYGTWACRIKFKNECFELWCGIKNDIPYLQSPVRPFSCFPIKNSCEALAKVL